MCKGNNAASVKRMTPCLRTEKAWELAFARALLTTTDGLSLALPPQKTLDTRRSSGIIVLTHLEARAWRLGVCDRPFAGLQVCKYNYAATASCVKCFLWRQCQTQAVSCGQ